MGASARAFVFSSYSNTCSGRVGYPYILIGTGLASIWIVYEACTLLGRGVSVVRRTLAICLMMGVFLLPILSESDMISMPLAIAIMAGLALGSYVLLGRGGCYLCCCWLQRFIVCPIFLPCQKEDLC